MKTYDECASMLVKLDETTLERRANRCQELTPITTRFAVQREWDYTSEASASYISGNYRSTIFCCACAIDQIFRYEYLSTHMSNTGKIERMSFGQLLDECDKSNVTRLTPFIKQASILNKIRNNIAIHPLFTDIPGITEDQKKMFLIREIQITLDVLDEIDTKLKGAVESTTLQNELDSESFTIGEILQNPLIAPYNISHFWHFIERDILKGLANYSWGIMKLIAEGLYGLDSYSESDN